MAKVQEISPDWYKDAVIYEVRLRSFYDENGDGIGDFTGLIEKLDYIRDLGVDTIWVLPFYPSPLVDDGYDIADYRGIHPELGTLRDFKRFLVEAHARGLRVVTELVLNHTSDQHAWFQRARRAPAGSVHRDFYVWSDNPSQYSGARIIFQDFEASNWTWDPVAKSYFWHRFYSNQPDLNFDNPYVVREMLDVVDFWLKLGIDGLRLDAVPYLFEREGTNCENLQETHGFLRKLRAHVDKKFPGRMLLAEANQWPEDAVAYFGQGDECHMCFHFPIMPRLFMGLRMEDSFPILDILEQTPSIPDGCQWAVFLRNHDELTLEMVTDEERDFMVGVYASDKQARVNLGIRRRLAPLMENNRSRIELMNALLFSLPGTPVLYYGDEIGMGDNIYLGDRNGVRTPMQWNGDRNAGFSRTNPQRLVLPPILDPEYHFSAVNVEAQQQNPSSLLWWTKRMIGMRRQHKAFGRGSFEPLFPDNRKVLAFLRRSANETLLIIANLSRFAQHVELDLRSFSGHMPIELFGGSSFPVIGEAPYSLMLSPHGYYWLSLSSAADERTSTIPTLALRLTGSLETALSAGHPGLLRALIDYTKQARWFRDKARDIARLRVEDTLPLSSTVTLCVLRFEFSSGEPSRYLVPVALAEANDPATSHIATIVGKAGAEMGSAVVDASHRPETADALLHIARTGRAIRGHNADLRGVPSKQLKKNSVPPGKALSTEQSNTTYRYGSEVVLKLLRLLESGTSVELEVLEHLETKPYFQATPALMGHLVLEKAGVSSTVGIVQAFVESRGDAFSYATDALSRVIEQALSHGPYDPSFRLPLASSRVCPPTPPLVEELVGGLFQQSRLLGKRTAEMHRALSDSDSADFRPEPWGSLSKRAFYQSLRNLSARSRDVLKSTRHSLEPETLELAERYLSIQPELASRFLELRNGELSGMRMRVHGDYHLGQVLQTGKDVVILDFEGEPGRSLSFRRGRRSPLADVAGMLRSFHYAALYRTLGEDHGGVRETDRGEATAWGQVFVDWLGGTFLEAYRDEMGDSPLLPNPANFRDVLEVHLLEKAIYELVYELNNRPRWASIPLRGILEIAALKTK